MEYYNGGSLQILHKTDEGKHLISIDLPASKISEEEMKDIIQPAIGKIVDVLGEGSPIVLWTTIGHQNFPLGEK